MGYVVKLLENIKALTAGGQDIDGLIDTALVLIRGGCDANPQEWETLNNAIENMDKPAAPEFKNSPKELQKNK